ncbi:MAG: hypothetical protein Q4F84_07030, partial [Fibrobacter sp.]|nr:hypothetical protein [Fibrobacter sp.]
MTLPFFSKKTNKSSYFPDIHHSKITSLIFFMIVTCWNIAGAQDSVQTKSGWKFSVLTNATITLNSYSENWSGDEFSTFSWMWQFTGTAEK